MRGVIAGTMLAERATTQWLRSRAAEGLQHWHCGLREASGEDWKDGWLRAVGAAGAAPRSRAMQALRRICCLITEVNALCIRLHDANVHHAGVSALARAQTWAARPNACACDVAEGTSQHTHTHNAAATRTGMFEYTGCTGVCSPPPSPKLLISTLASGLLFSKLSGNAVSLLPPAESGADPM